MFHDNTIHLLNIITICFQLKEVIVTLSHNSAKILKRVFAMNKLVDDG